MGALLAWSKYTYLSLHRGHARSRSLLSGTWSYAAREWLGEEPAPINSGLEGRSHATL